MVNASKTVEAAKPTLYAELLAAGCTMEHHESDLYVKADKVSFAILGKREHAGWKASGFNSSIDHSLWLEVPFAFDPFWTARQTTGGAL